MFLQRIMHTRLAWHIAAILVVLSMAFAYNTTRVEARPDDSAFLVNTRTALRMCAQVSPALAGQAGQLRGQLAQSLRTLRQTNRSWQQAYGAATEPPALETACSVKIPQKALDQLNSTAVGLGMVRNPTPFRTVFLVLDEATADTVLGTRKAGLAPYEMMQVDDHEAVEVTSALVVRQSALADEEVVQKYMAIAVGLMPEVPLGPPPGEQSPTLKPANHDAGS